MTEKTFAKGIKAKEFGNYGSIKLSINTSELFDKQNNISEATGWGNFVINKSKNGNLYVVVDNWKPEPKNENIVEFKNNNDDINTPW